MMTIGFFFHRFLFVKRSKWGGGEGRGRSKAIEGEEIGKLSWEVASCELSRLRVVFVEGFSFLDSLIRVLLGERERENSTHKLDPSSGSTFRSYVRSSFILSQVTSPSSLSTRSCYDLGLLAIPTDSLCSLFQRERERNERKSVDLVWAVGRNPYASSLILPRSSEYKIDALLPFQWKRKNPIRNFVPESFSSTQQTHSCSALTNSFRQKILLECHSSPVSSVHTPCTMRTGKEGKCYVFLSLFSTKFWHTSLGTRHPKEWNTYSGYNRIESKEWTSRGRFE